MPESLATLQAISEALALGHTREAKRLVRLALTATETQLAEYEAYICRQEERLLEDAQSVEYCLPF